MIVWSAAPHKRCGALKTRVALQASAREDYGAEDPRCVAMRRRLVEHMRAADSAEPGASRGGGGLELDDLAEHGHAGAEAEAGAGAGDAPATEPDPEPEPEPEPEAH
jgi:hypothetical protein